MNAKPVIIIDSREQTPLPFTRLETITGNLYSGDYSITGMEGIFSIERKSIDDLMQSITTGRERFERELHRLRGYRFKRLLVIGSMNDIHAHRYKSQVKPQSVLATLGAFEVRYDCPVVFSASPDVAGQIVERWAFWFWREAMKPFAVMKGSAT